MRGGVDGQVSIGSVATKDEIGRTELNLLANKTQRQEERKRNGNMTEGIINYTKDLKKKTPKK